MHNDSSTESFTFIDKSIMCFLKSNILKMKTEFDTLLLLVGTNPLPNFVVAEYFLTTNSNLRKIVFVYSEHTKYQRSTGEYAEKIQQRLLLRHPNRRIDFIKIPLSDISLPKAIEKDLKARLSSHLHSSNSVHLNYTGGTKSMGIHVYNYLLKNFYHQKTFSYLDARTFKIVFDETETITDDLRDQIRLNITEINELHGFERIPTKPVSLDDYNKALDIFKELINQKRLIDYFDSYRGELFRKDESLIEKAKILSETLKEFKAKGALFEIDQSLPESLRLFNADGSLRQSLTNQTVKTAVRFFDGVWLELYVLRILKELAETYSLSVEHDLVLRKKHWAVDTKFQLDIVLVKGYQLLGISCTTSNQKSICKNKGFEIFLRSRQIGGEESRAILITRLSEKVRAQLEDELQVDTGGSQSILVLGENDLKYDILTQRVIRVLN